MEIDYSIYELTPTKQLNRFENTKRKGVILKIDQKYFLDYFPWREFGDATVEQFLTELRESKRLPVFLDRDLSVEMSRKDIEHRSFKNHYFDGDKGLVKIKYLGDMDELVKRCNSFDGLGLRIDFNSALKLKQALEFWSSIKSKSKIDYLEDPCPYSYEAWSELKEKGIPLASDREVVQIPVDYGVIKPNRDEIKKDHIKLIFSNYMGHNLGVYHAFLHLMRFGDLNLYHGLVTPGIYEELPDLFLPNGEQTYRIDEEVISELYQSLKEKKWTPLI